MRKNINSLEEEEKKSKRSPRMGVGMNVRKQNDGASNLSNHSLQEEVQSCSKQSKRELVDMTTRHDAMTCQCRNVIAM